MITDPVDPIMQVMQQAFDPAYGEAWTRRQVADSLLLPNTHYLLASPHDHEPHEIPEDVFGFTLSRQVLDEEELLLIAVSPSQQRSGVGKILMQNLFAAARERGVLRMVLEMREGNPAQKFYAGLGFEQIGRRRDYYRGAAQGPLDALTFIKSL